MLKHTVKLFALAAVLAVSAVGAEEECSGIAVLQGQGTVVDINKEDISKVGDASWDANTDAVILAHSQDKDGALKFGSIMEKLGVSRFDFGMQFGMRIKTNNNKESGYGFIMSYGGDEECVHERVMNRDGRLFSSDSEHFCKGVTFAAWVDGAKRGIFLLNSGRLVADFSDTQELEIFDKWHCVTMQVRQPTTTEKGTVTFSFDGSVLAHPISFHAEDLDGDGHQVFAYGSTPKEGHNVEIEMEDIEFKTTRDISDMNLMEVESTVTSSVQNAFAISLVGMVLMAAIAKVAYQFGRSSMYEEIGGNEMLIA
eukprot:CAMPEP_0113938354 /NCGR_PEP_ID=MMETSP1339-20121228/4799_1 /TAXON_ID=94617 /ORGANISM="Fibrocapsa japonica" /LENGTH=310 /DNA_ID=CAMNT_0000941443 /DNA_START=56 /DNA_END=988 /DNA_ORIENTATION=- /assembly_acc=CAM_ASM_000762